MSELATTPVSSHMVFQSLQHGLDIKYPFKGTNCALNSTLFTYVMHYKAACFEVFPENNN